MNADDDDKLHTLDDVLDEANQAETDRLETAAVQAPPALAARLTERPRYEIEQIRTTNRWAVVRFGPKGGKKIVNHYQATDLGHTAALTLRATLSVWVGDE